MLKKVQGLTLYYSPFCGFCVYVLNAVKGLDIEMEMRNVSADSTHRQELIQGGGRATVPCLRITEADGSQRWMYESRVIVNYLKEQFDESSPRES